MLEVWDGAQLEDELVVEIWNDNSPAPDFLFGRLVYPLEEALLTGLCPNEEVVHLKQDMLPKGVDVAHGAPGNDMEWREDKQMQFTLTSECVPKKDRRVVVVEKTYVITMSNMRCVQSSAQGGRRGVERVCVCVCLTARPLHTALTHHHHHPPPPPPPRHPQSVRHARDRDRRHAHRQQAGPVRAVRAGGLEGGVELARWRGDRV